MSLDFGKLNFSISFNPTSAFPIDARSYFESYAEAARAAAGAKPVGSSDSRYYFGQTLVVVENGRANFYIIQPNHSLMALTGAESITVNPQLFERDANGNLSLKGFDTAALGSFISIGANGELQWVDAYTKNEIDQKIREAIASIPHMQRKIFASLDEVEAFIATISNAEQYIFMLPSGTDTESDKYNEYIAVRHPDDNTYIIEKVGSWNVDLTDYATVSEVKTWLHNKVNVVAGSRLMKEEEGEKLNKLLPFHSVDKTLQLNLDTGELSVKEVAAEQVTNLKTWITAHSNVVKGLSEENFTTQLLEKLTAIPDNIGSTYISSVNEDEFIVNEQGQLNIKTIASAKIGDLSELLKAKADADRVTQLETIVDNLSDDVDDIRARFTWTEI